MLRNLMRLPGSRLVSHAVLVFVIWRVMVVVNDAVDPLMNYYIALVAMYATAMFGMVILVGLSGQVSLGNGALMAVGGYVFALTTLNWQTVPFTSIPMNGFWAMLFAAIGGVLAGLLIGVLGARLRGPYLAGLTLGIAVGIPAIANRFPELLGGETGLQITVPYPDGGYAPVVDESIDQSSEVLPTEQAPLPSSSADELTLDSFPTAQPSGAVGDELTLDSFPTEQAPLPSGSADELTLDSFPTAQPSGGAGDELTLDSFPTASPDALASPGALPSAPGPVLAPGPAEAGGDGDLGARTGNVPRPSLGTRGAVHHGNASRTTGNRGPGRRRNPPAGRVRRVGVDERRGPQPRGRAGPHAEAGQAVQGTRGQGPAGRDRHRCSR